MTARTRFAIVLAATGLTLAATSSAHAGALRFDLGGTWTGKISCKTFVGGAKDKFTLTPTMRINQSGLEIGLVLAYANGDTESYSGLSNPDAAKPFEKGEVAVVFCGTNDTVGDEPTYDELGRISVKTKQGAVKATFKGTSIFSDPGTGLETEAGTCKWSFKRISTDPTGVATTCLTGLTLPPAP